MKKGTSSYSCTNNVISGCNEALIDTGSQISSNLIAYDNSLCLYGNSTNDYSMFGVQQTVNYQSHCSIIFSGPTLKMPEKNLKDPFQEETHHNFMHVQEDIFYQPWNSVSLQQSGNELVRNARKRAVESSDATNTTSSSICSFTNSETYEGAQDKRSLKRFQEEQPKIRKEKVPTVRRSQKLTDKITALQKLVSPYGKTDTASVLLEASISIKALQDQIEELFHQIPWQETTNMIGEKETDLQSRGICLVPCVSLKELERRFPMHCFLQ